MRWSGGRVGVGHCVAGGSPIASPPTALECGAPTRRPQPPSGVGRSAPLTAARPGAERAAMSAGEGCVPGPTPGREPRRRQPTRVTDLSVGRPLSRAAGRPTRTEASSSSKPISPSVPSSERLPPCRRRGGGDAAVGAGGQAAAGQGVQIGEGREAGLLAFALALAAADRFPAPVAAELEVEEHAASLRLRRVQVKAWTPDLHIGVGRRAACRRRRSGGDAARRARGAAGLRAPHRRLEAGQAGPGSAEAEPDRPRGP